MTAPIVLFVYNRPQHTAATLEALKANHQAENSDLYIYSDGPKKPADAALVEEVRDVCRTVEGFRSVQLLCSSENRGLAESIIKGVSEVVARHGRVIVLEDDLVTSPHFLQFMNDALEAYQHTDRVMHVSGATYPVSWPGNDTCYFQTIPLCWGWATWDRAWRYFARDIAVMDRFSRLQRWRFNYNGAHRYWDQLVGNQQGRIKTWFIFWYAQVFLRGGLSLFPPRSLVRNIGFDGSGIHCGTSGVYTAEAADKAVLVETNLPLVVSRQAFKAHVVFFNLVGHSRWRRRFEKLRRMLLGPT
ncbi:glycosyltransferase [Sphaerotilus microaerophilus]|uniref:Glycosyl transferase n=1 Tax=Sphaerotilus microaerophilus TaxID=2914710 RepID=A0ABN6PNR6_9BURK|nr:glycosyltransferase family A protein [Sphaerotilus sp. FB-5]BDI04935.1 glycosyl transferase [Sphaerotilus sp. FB-5]